MKITIYLPDELKASLSQIALRQGVSEAKLVRQALRDLVAKSSPPKPTLPLFRSDKPLLAGNVDKVLRGLGEQ